MEENLDNCNRTTIKIAIKEQRIMNHVYTMECDGGG